MNLPNATTTEHGWKRKNISIRARLRVKETTTRQQTSDEQLTKPLAFLQPPQGGDMIVATGVSPWIAIPLSS
jgi:hypothetical protein